MRRFKFVGDPNMFDWDLKPVVSNIYPENHFGTKNGIPFTPVFLDWVDITNWQEVFDHVGLSNSKTLHKDTDLGYFAGLTLQGLLSNSNIDQVKTDVVYFAILKAQELIEQLNEELKNNQQI